MSDTELKCCKCGSPSLMPDSEYCKVCAMDEEESMMDQARHMLTMLEAGMTIDGCADGNADKARELLRRLRCSGAAQPARDPGCPYCNALPQSAGSLEQKGGEAYQRTLEKFGPMLQRLADGPETVAGGESRPTSALNTEAQERLLFAALTFGKRGADTLANAAFVHQLCKDVWLEHERNNPRI